MSSKKAKVLIVDDDSTIRALLSTLLLRATVEVEEAENGQVALEKVTTEMPSLIFLDLKMPVMNGFDFIKEFRAKYGMSVPVVVVSGIDDIAVRACELGATDHIAKPFHIETIAQKLRIHLGL